MPYRDGRYLPLIAAVAVAWGLFRLLHMRQWARATAAVLATGLAAAGFWLAVFRAPPYSDRVAVFIPLAVTVVLAVIFPILVVVAVASAAGKLEGSGGTWKNDLSWRPRSNAEGRARLVGLVLGAFAVGIYGAATVADELVRTWLLPFVFAFGYAGVHEGLLQGFLGFDQRRKRHGAV